VPKDTPCETLTVAEAADVLGISRSSAHRLIAQTGKLGPLTPIRIGRRIVFGWRQVELVLAGGAE
jgi:predicted DNA-binding transcriptional regulator AlpA